MENDALSRRAYPRKLLQGNGLITNPASEQKLPITLLDISLGGVAFLATAEIAKDSLWLVRFPVGEETMTGNIQIAYCIKHLLTDAYRVGAQFKRLRPDQLAIVERYTQRNN